MGSSGPDPDGSLGSYATVSSMRLSSFKSAPGSSSAVALMSCATPTERAGSTGRDRLTDRPCSARVTDLGQRAGLLNRVRFLHGLISQRFETEGKTVAQDAGL